jgi:hypothetical protein
LVKQSHCRPGQALRVPGAWGFQISRQSAHESVRFQPYAPATFTPRKYFWYSFLLEAVSSPGVNILNLKTESVSSTKIHVLPSVNTHRRAQY